MVAAVQEDFAYHLDQAVVVHLRKIPYFYPQAPHIQLQLVVVVVEQYIILPLLLLMVLILFYNPLRLPVEVGVVARLVVVLLTPN